MSAASFHRRQRGQKHGNLRRSAGEGMVNLPVVPHTTYSNLFCIVLSLHTCGDRSIVLGTLWRSTLGASLCLCCNVKLCHRRSGLPKLILGKWAGARYCSPNLAEWALSGVVSFHAALSYNSTGCPNETTKISESPCCWTRVPHPEPT